MKMQISYESFNTNENDAQKMKIKFMSNNNNKINLVNHKLHFIIIRQNLKKKKQKLDKISIFFSHKNRF